MGEQPADDNSAENGETENQDAVPVVEIDNKPTTDNLADGFLERLRDNGLTYEEMERWYDLSNDQARNLLDRMREAGWVINFETLDAQGTRRWYIPKERDKRYLIGDGDGTYRFGLISDTHLGSKTCHLEDLHDFYDRLWDRGVEIVLHGGDISDGWKIHRDQINTLHGEATGWDRLLDYCVQNYPRRDGMETLFISGNHDHKLWKRSGVRFGEQLGNRREDLNWLGDSMARLVFDQKNDIDLELIHPSGGKPYTLGYRAQTLYREQPTSIRPTLSSIAHLHGRLWGAAEGVETFYSGCWKDLTTWGKRKGHAAEIGGWDVELTIADGRVDNITTNWISYKSDDNKESNHKLKNIQQMVGGDLTADASELSRLL